MSDPDADYVCSLDDATIQKAKNELYEDPLNRLGAVKTLRKWIEDQDYITCPIDTHFLLKFLRARKFSQLETRKLIEGYLARRQRFKHWYLNLDPVKSRIMDAIDFGLVLILPGTDDQGRKVMILRPGRLYEVEKRKMNKNDIIQTITSVLEWLIMSEAVQVHGLIQVLDFSGYSFTHRFVTMEDRKNFIGTWQKAFPCRIKQIHMYNTGGVIEILFTFIKMAMTEKMQKRVIVHGTVLEGMYKDIPMRMWPNEYLPDDYTGPNAGSIEDITANMKKELSSKAVCEHIKEVTKDKWRVDMDKKPNDIPQASFQRLKVE